MHLRDHDHVEFISNNLRNLAVAMGCDFRVGEASLYSAVASRTGPE